jgi:hypothetical protein
MPKTAEQRERARLRRLARKSSPEKPTDEAPKGKRVGTWNGTVYHEGDNVAPWVTLSGGPVPISYYDPESPYSYYQGQMGSLRWIKAHLADMGDLLETLQLDPKVSADGADCYNLAKARTLYREVERILQRVHSRHVR